MRLFKENGTLCENFFGSKKLDAIKTITENLSFVLSIKSQKKWNIADEIRSLDS